MTTRETLEAYFDALEKGGDWQSFLAENMVFASHTSPAKQVTGKAAYLAATKRFYSTIQSVEVRGLLVEENKACAQTRYQLRGPGGNTFQSDVAEIFEVRNGQIQAFSIYFDSAPFPK